jgi:hypothetical protein
MFSLTSIRRDVVQPRLHVGSEKDHMKPYLLWLVALCVMVGMCFCTVPISGDDLDVTINGPDD